MTDVPDPTAEDRARSAAADLAVCDAASRGPWSAAKERGLLDWIRNDREPTEEDRVIGWQIAVVKSIARHDLAFVCLARTALPAWIRRAIAAEADVAALQQQVEGMAARIVAQSELLTRRVEKTS